MALIAPTVETIGDEALTNSIIDRSITELQDNLVTDLGQYALYGCTALNKVVFGAVNVCDDYAISGCTVLEVADFHQNVRIDKSAFTNCPGLRAVILRSDTLCSLLNTSAFTSSGIANGTGYIYVPAALVDSYKTATNWSTYASQIRAIEDYPEVCSTRGKVWVLSNITNNACNGLARGDNMWVAVAQNSYPMYSTDGKTWVSSKSGPYGATTVSYDSGLWVVTSNSSTYGGIYYSEDGKNWTKSNVTGEVYGKTACYKGVWLGRDYYSEDGKTWTQNNFGFTASKFVCSPDLVVALCNSGGIYYSEDGKNWTKSNVTSGSAAGGAYANGMWQAGIGGIYYSEDGKNWTKSNVTTGSFRAFEYANGLWMAGSTQYVYYSEDGKNWTKLSNYSCDAICYADGRWILGSSTASSGTYGLYYSEDGKTCVRSNVTSGGVTDILSADGVAVATLGGNYGRGIYYSE